MAPPSSSPPSTQIWLLYIIFLHLTGSLPFFNCPRKCKTKYHAFHLPQSVQNTDQRLHTPLYGRENQFSLNFGPCSCNCISLQRYTNYYRVRTVNTHIYFCSKSSAYCKSPTTVQQIYSVTLYFYIAVILYFLSHKWSVMCLCASNVVMCSSNGM